MQHLVPSLTWLSQLLTHKASLQVKFMAGVRWKAKQTHAHIHGLANAHQILSSKSGRKGEKLKNLIKNKPAMITLQEMAVLIAYMVYKWLS